MSLDGPFNITLDSNDVTFNILGDEKLRLTSLGNVGIGTTSPGNKLEVVGGATIKNGTFSNGQQDRIDEVPMGLGSASALTLTETSEYSHNPYHISNKITFNVLNASSNNGVGAVIGAYKIGQHNFGSGLFFSTTNTEDQTYVRMVIKDNGNVGIGTTSPQRLLHLSNDSGNTIFHMTSRDSGSSANDGFSIVYAADNHMYFNQRENANMIFYTNNTERMRIAANGYIGIGTTSPLYPLHVDSSKVQSFSNLYYFSQYTSNYIMTNTDSYHTSIYANSSIIGGVIGAHSDRRIKKDIIEINDDTALQKIRLLKPCKYKYKDPFSRNNEFGEVIGFIAQEVKEAIPLAVKEDTGDIPNIMIMGSAAIDASNNHILTIPDFDTSSLEVDASGNVFTKLKILINEDGNSKELYVSIQEVVSATELKVEMLDNEITELPSEVFIYGQEVDNKSILVKDRIFSVGMSALQEIDRQQQADKARIATLEQSLALLEARLSALENPST